MERSFNRRRFLQQSGIFGSSLLICSIPFDRSASAVPAKIEVNAVDQLTIRQVTDGSHDIFLDDAEYSGLKVSRTGPLGSVGKTLESEWGLALHLESKKGQETRRYLLDFGFMPTTYQNNLSVLNIDVSQIDALIISHGHYDHTGGLTGFLEAQRPLMRKDLRLYLGGEDDFCNRFNRRADGSLSNSGFALDRRKLRAMNVEPVIPVVITADSDVIPSLAEV